jgi:alkylation response protein AidB-like acyl-CoA dehydrogenase
VTTPAITTPAVEQFAAEAGEWLAANAARRAAVDDEKLVWGEGEFNVAVFHNLDHAAEAALLADLRAWNQRRAERGYHAIRWPTEFGGLGLGAAHGRAYQFQEAQYETPDRHELFSVTTGLIPQTIRAFGTAEQQERFIAALLRTDIYACQLFS